MDGKGAMSAIQARDRDALKTPNLSKPAARPVAVSAAAVFKRRKLDAPQRPSSHSPQKPILKKTDRKVHAEELHPLALAFRETSEEYRRHLYSSAVTRINTDLAALLRKLYESNLQIASSEPANNGAQASPLKLTVPAKYQRLVRKLCNPLSNHRYNLQRTNASGEVERMQITLHDRFKSFEGNIEVEMEEIKGLQRRWEGVVAEIFQLGIACLGESDMAALLSTADPDMDEAESTLFVAEHKSSAKNVEGKRKRVSFAGPDMTSLFPEFLFHTSRQQKKLVPATPDLSAEEVQLEQAILDLGKQHVANLQRLKKEHQAWWKKKQTQLAHTFLQD